MRLIALCFAVSILTASPLYARQAGARTAWLYAYSGLGGSSGAASFHVGGGGEILAARGFGAAVDASYFAPTSRFFDNSLRTVSAGVAYHFGGRDSMQKGVPFLTGGVSLANGRHAGVNFGAGFQYWFRPRAALRVEFREFVFSSDSPYLYGIHLGLAFR